MDLYSLVKTLHIISATIVFGTGLGIAHFMLMGYLSDNPLERAFAARMTVRADFLFTLPSVIFQPLSGIWLIWQSGLSGFEPWLLATYALYVLAGLCWVPVVFIQIRLKQMFEAQLRGEPLDQARCQRLFRSWFILGWPAFLGLVVIFWLMVRKSLW